MSKRTSDRYHWEKFWTKKKDPGKIYDNSGRIPVALFELTQDVKDKRVLEVGAGTGRDSFTIAEEGAKVYVLDYADAALDIVKSLNSQNEEQVIPIQGDAFALPFPDNSLDIVFHQGLLEHFRDPWGILRENYRVLKPGGLAIIDVPQRWHIYTLVKHILIPLGSWFAGWETEFSVRQLEKSLRKHGLEPVALYGDWMYPCFGYRIFREICWKLGIHLPLYPPKVPILWRIRRFLREKLRRTRLGANTAVSIGILAKKVEKTTDNRNTS